MRKNTGYANPLRSPLVIIFENDSSRSSNLHHLRISTGFANSKFTLRIKFADHFFRTPTLRNFATLRKFHFVKITLCKNYTLRKLHFAKIPLCKQSLPLIFLCKKKKKSVALVLKPKQSPRGIWQKSLKPGALNLNWLGVADLNARYKGEWVKLSK